MDDRETFKYTPTVCHSQILELSQRLLNSPHKELVKSFEVRLKDYRMQGTLYGLLLSGTLVALSWTRFKGLKVHVPGAAVSVLFGMALGALVGVAFGSESAVQEMGRIAEDKELDEMRTKILDNCVKRKMKPN